MFTFFYSKWWFHPYFQFVIKKKPGSWGVELALQAWRTTPSPVLLCSEEENMQMRPPPYPTLLIYGKKSKRRDELHGSEAVLWSQAHAAFQFQSQITSPLFCLARQSLRQAHIKSLKPTGWENDCVFWLLGLQDRWVLDVHARWKSQDSER